MDTIHHRDAAEAQLPLGCRFHPTDEELVTYYLVKKVFDSSFTARAIAEVDLNKCEPWELPVKAKMGENEWYFYNLRDRKYRTGLRTNRATEAGYWNSTGKDMEIFGSRTGSLVGMKKTLVFYKGRAPKGKKTNWVMHEYRLEGKLSYHNLPTISKDEWVVSRVFQKSGGKKTVGSPSSSSLRPLLDSSLYTPVTDQETYSYESKSAREHVPCFPSSTAGAPTNFSHRSFDTPHVIGNQMGRFGNGGTATFPSLWSQQDNLQIPFFFSAVAPMQGPSSGLEHQIEMGDGSLASNWSECEQKVESSMQLQMGTTELDWLWTY